MKKLFLIRHGQSEANAQRSLLYDKDRFEHTFQLTELGRRQARECGKTLNKQIRGPYAVYVSPYARARETWEQIEFEMDRDPSKILVDGRLREQEFTKFDNAEEYLEKNALRKAQGNYPTASMAQSRAMTF